MAYVNALFNTNFLEYASYVIKDRAIPHLDDGLKPVQRRILHSLFEMDDGKLHKVANVVGHCMKYHPHGDQSIFSALVVLANKELFIEKQGNFGNLSTGDEASAPRYIECRITPFARQVLHNPSLTTFVDSYDGRNREPEVFPAKIPVVLVLGAEGIAVGMSTRILPHNFIEVMEAVKASLLGEHLQLFPDFPSGGAADVSEYEDGLGKVLVRAKFDTKDSKKIVIRELPFGTTTEGLISSIESAARKGRIKIAEISDYTADKVEIEIKLARGVYAKEVVDSLYAYTDCEQSLTVNLLIIRDNKPVNMQVGEVIDYHANGLLQILTRELEFEQKTLRDSLHARTLERIFIEERIYKQIEEMETQEAVHQAIVVGFKPFSSQVKRKITDEDIERLLRIPIRRISLYDINKARKEMQEIQGRLKKIGYHLKHMTDYAVNFVETIIKENRKKYPRKTEIVSFERVDARDVAQRTLALHYDEKQGYLGYRVSSGRSILNVSQFDRILVIRKSGMYSVVDAPEKLFVDKGMLACGIADKEQLANTIISVVYRDDQSGGTYLKRCKIEQYIIEKAYSLVPEGGRVLKLTTKTEVSVVLLYKPKPRLKVLEEVFPLANYLIKSVRASGVRLSAKEVKSAKFVSAQQLQGGNGKSDNGRSVS